MYSEALHRILLHCPKIIKETWAYNHRLPRLVVGNLCVFIMYPIQHIQLNMTLAETGNVSTKASCTYDCLLEDCTDQAADVIVDITRPSRYDVLSCPLSPTAVTLQYFS